MKRFLQTLVFLVIIVIAFGWYKIETAPRVNLENFSAEAADQTNTPFNEIYKGEVLEVLTQTADTDPRLMRFSGSLQVKLLNGPDAGREVEVSYDDPLVDLQSQELRQGDAIVIGKIVTADETSYVMVDRYRLPVLIYAIIFFLILAIIFGRLRGFTSLIGLVVSIFILLNFVTPNILEGKNPVVVVLIGAAAIALVSMFLAHGFNKRTLLAVVSTLLTLGLAEGLGYGLIVASRLLGNGSEEAFFLQSGYFGAINLQGLLLGGMLIGTLGILNDVTIAQSAAVEELHGANPKLTFKELYAKGGSIGREHIASLINTLVLVYAGASLPLFLLLSINNKELWPILNSATIAEEIIRTLVGSIALIIAVPITTGLSAYYFSTEIKKIPASVVPAKDTDDYWDKAKKMFGE
jgi:uncharacterized membrane protein